MSERYFGQSVIEWIPHGTQRILDIGCSSGYDTARLAGKAQEVYGVDTDAATIKKATQLHNNIVFSVADAGLLPFPDHYLESILMSEVLEHVRDEHAALKEAHRVLRSGGTLVLTVPHKGLFSFLDPANQKYYLRQSLPGLYRWFISFKTKRDPTYTDTLAQGFHRPYSRSDLVALLDCSQWIGQYLIVRTRYRSLVLGPLVGIIKAVLGLWLGKTLGLRIIRPLCFFAAREGRISFGTLSNQI